VTESIVLPPDARDGIMPQSQIRQDPSLLPIERPRCPKCQSGRMMLARITPGRDHSDLRTFECPKCNYVHNVVVEDPLKSAAWAGITVDYTRLGKPPQKSPSGRDRRPHRPMDLLAGVEVA
jgi:hypothetical protein